MNLPAGPKLPQSLRIIHSLFRPTEALETYRHRFGDTFTLTAPGNAPLVVCSHPDDLQVIFANPARFDSGKGNQILRFLLGEQSLILLDGDRHQRQRQLLTPPFHGERMRTYGQLIGDITQQVIEQWTVGESLVVRLPMQAITLTVILRAVFGLSEGDRLEQLKGLLTQLLDSISSPLSASVLFFASLQKDWGEWSPWGRFLRLKQQVDQLLYAEIRDRRRSADPNRTDILSLLLSARDEAGQPMSDEELHDELMTLLVAGHETTASSLSWALYWVYTQPDRYHRLRHELKTVAAGDPMAITQLPYLTAICQETLRIYPIAMFSFPRILKAPMQFSTYSLEAGTWLLPCIYLTHQRPDVYPNPKEFRPERFLERQFSPYEYLPFGGSNRRCIGMAFAQFEMKLVLATIVSQVELALSHPRSVRPVRRGLTLAPAAGLRMTVVNSTRSDT
ncbi:cytochrome P450 [Oculatella sp. LEGE 06141]|uniref:cytochrome P450 n=1 Tax=Oculatella sp. LEGE 06141 TaxID=1828648 RepID=UPI00187EE76E|nr:cytochrome P450 [Oculatella sp. LEGE 06141]MBE9179545.1 cytochrome P450 [Oculatella sp. LEGE 06141]